MKIALLGAVLHALRAESARGAGVAPRRLLGPLPHRGLRLRQQPQVFADAEVRAGVPVVHLSFSPDIA